MTTILTLKEAVMTGNIETSLTETRNALDTGLKVQEILDAGLIAAMDDVGEKFAKGLLFVPQMLRSAKAMQECMKLLEPLFKESDITPKGTLVIGTVQKDLHDIGKNLVAMMMGGAGFSIEDLGVDVAPDQFVQKTIEMNANIVAMSALLSTTMPAMLETIEALRKAGKRDSVKVLIGGAPVTSDFADEIQADAYAPDAGSAVIEAKRLLGIS
jgi:5-methyltetrahydrofolate--homocysteine methyltransferase